MRIDLVLSPCPFGTLSVLWVVKAVLALQLLKDFI